VKLEWTLTHLVTRTSTVSKLFTICIQTKFVSLYLVKCAPLWEIFNRICRFKFCLHFL